MTKPNPSRCFFLAIQLMLALCAAPGILAQDRPPLFDRWKRDDRNSDGKVSREEFTGARQMFDRLDKNRDGYVTEDELPKGRGGEQAQSTGKEVTFKSADGLA